MPMDQKGKKQWFFFEDEITGMLEDIKVSQDILFIGTEDWVDKQSQTHNFIA